MKKTLTMMMSTTSKKPVTKLANMLFGEPNDVLQVHMQGIESYPSREISYAERGISGGAKKEDDGSYLYLEEGDKRWRLTELSFFVIS